MHALLSGLARYRYWDLRTGTRHLECRFDSLTPLPAPGSPPTCRTLRSGESRQRIWQGWRGDEGARTTMELGTGDQLAVFIGDRQLETLLSKERLRRSAR